MFAVDIDTSRVVVAAPLVLALNPYTPVAGSFFQPALASYLAAMAAVEEASSVEVAIDVGNGPSIAVP